MQSNPYPDPNFYCNMRDETVCINSTCMHAKYAPVRKLSRYGFLKPIFVISHTMQSWKTQNIEINRLSNKQALPHCNIFSNLTNSLTAKFLYPVRSLSLLIKSLAGLELPLICLETLQHIDNPNLIRAAIFPSENLVPVPLCSLQQSSPSQAAQAGNWSY